MFKKLFHNIGQFFKGHSNIIKLAVWILILQIMFSLFSLAFFSSDEDYSQWMILLSVFMAISYIAIVFAVSRSSAYSDFQVYKSNYIRRKKGEEIPRYKVMREYGKFKGLWAGITAALPTIILIAFGLIKSPVIKDSNACAQIAAIINMVYFVPVINLGGAGTLYSILYGCVLTAAAAGAGYYMQGYKLEMQFKELQKGSLK